MQQTIINGFRVMVFTGYDGTQLFINHPDGHNIYAHRVSGDALERAREVIAAETPEAFAPADKMICLSDRKDEFKAAMRRGIDDDLRVEADTEADSFLVINRTNYSDYRVRLETRENGKTYSSCECKDYKLSHRDLFFTAACNKRNAPNKRNIVFGIIGNRDIFAVRNFN